MPKTYRLITMLVFLSLTCMPCAAANEPLQPVPGKDPNKQVVGTTEKPDVTRQLGAFSPVGGAIHEPIMVATMDGKLRPSPNSFSVTQPFLETRGFLWKLILPPDDQLKKRVARYMQRPRRDHPARVTGHVRIEPDQRKKDGTVTTGYFLHVTSMQVGRTELVGVTSPDGRLLVVGHDNGELNIFEASTGKLKANYAGLDAEKLAPSQADSWLPTVLFSPTSKTLAIQRGTEGVLLWSPPSGQLVHLLVKHGLVGMRIGKFSRYGRFLLVHASGPKGKGPGALVVYETSQGKEVLHVPQPAAAPYATADFSSDATRLVVIDAAGKATTWRLPPRQ